MSSRNNATFCLHKMHFQPYFSHEMDIQTPGWNPGIHPIAVHRIDTFLRVCVDIFIIVEEINILFFSRKTPKKDLPSPRNTIKTHTKNYNLFISL